MTPAGLVFTVVMGILLIAVPRRYALLPIAASICYMTMGQTLVILGLHFPVIRILMLFGWARVLLRSEFRSFRLNALDKVIIWWVASAVVTYTLLWQTTDALTYRLGLAYNALGMYFLFRILLRSLKDVEDTIKFLAALIVPLAAAMCLEKVTGRNPFAVFGGVFEVSWVRDGVVRCQGPFGHAILAGTFAATLFPMFIGLFWLGKKSDKFFAACGFIGACIIVIMSGSSGPVFTFISGALGLGFWFARRYTHVIRRGIVLVLILLSLVMKAPIWYLIAHVGVFNGSDAWHRAYLMDRAIANFGDWWLIGTKSTEKWGPSLHDVTNAYIEAGATGGLITMILFVAIIVYAFRLVGRSSRIAEKIHKRRTARLVWSSGASLLAHTVTYVSVTYFDQNFVNWYLLLAIISTLSEQLSIAKSENTRKSVQISVPRALPAELADSHLRTASLACASPLGYS